MRKAISYYDSYNFTLYDLISDAQKVLDIGCAEGKLGEQLKLRKNCFVAGVEIDENLAMLAKERYDKVIIGDIENLSELPFPDRFFDAIIFGDVLEHLKNPEAVLLQIKRYLQDDGFIAMSIPNVAFLMVRMKLLLGKFDYAEEGILDRTHLRFYTLKTLKSMVSRCGYKIVLIKVRTPRWYLSKLANLWKGLLAYEFVIMAKK